MYAIVDCDNCYVSCERVFRPDLRGKPVVVLSNNDGCVVARSNEAKRMGIKAGTPAFQLMQQYSHGEVTVFSSNYELYGELTGRVGSIVRSEAPASVRYSIDEWFVKIDGLSSDALRTWGERLHQRIMRSVGIPVSIGIAPTKTLAKMASHFAKRYLGYNHCCLIDSDERRLRALQLYPIAEVWGIGRRYAARLEALGVATALDFATHAVTWVRASVPGIVVERTWRELQGEDCVPNEEWSPRQSICTSRSFSHLITTQAELATHVANFAAHCAYKLRRQQSVASAVGVMLSTNPFRDDLPQHHEWQDVRLITPTASTIELTSVAHALLARLFRQGYGYKRAGVTLSGIVPATPLQQDLFDTSTAQRSRLSRLDAVVDSINRVQGADTLRLASQHYHREPDGTQPASFTDAMRHDFRSPCPTTRWSDIIKL